MPLVINEQLSMCEGSDCPDFGVDRVLGTVTFLPQCVKQILSSAGVMICKRKGNHKLVS